MINLGFYTGSGSNVRYQRTGFDYLLTGVAFLPVLAGCIYTVSDSADWGLVFSGKRYVGNGNVAFVFGVGMQYVCSSPILPFCISGY